MQREHAQKGSLAEKFFALCDLLLYAIRVFDIQLNGSLETQNRLVILLEHLERQAQPVIALDARFEVDCFERAIRRL